MSGIRNGPGGWKCVPVLDLRDSDGVLLPEGTWRIPRVDNPPRGQNRQWAWKTKSRFEKGRKS